MASSSWRRHASTADRTAFSIAVLPLLNLSAGKDDERLSDGLTDEIINELSNEHRLRVLARTSTFQFKGKAEDLRALGARLQVSAILEGSVWKNTDRLRVAVRLVNVADGYPFWSDAYDQALKQDVLSAQQEISRAIAGTLQNRLWDGQTRLAPAYTENLAVYNLYLEGVRLQRSASEEDLKNSLASFQKAIATEGNYAPAYAGLAGSYTTLAMLGLAPPREVLPKAKEAAERARALDDGLAEAHTALGMNRAIYEWNWTVAKREFQRALELNPGDGGTHRAYALTWLVPRGELGEALAELQAFQKLAPVSPGQPAFSAAIRYYRREYNQAIQEYQRELEGNPTSYMAYVGLGSASALKGRYGEAEAALQRGRVAWGGGLGAALLADTFTFMGARRKAQEMLHELTALAPARYVSKYCLALAELGLGAREQALRRLEEAAEQREPMLIYLNVDPWFDNLRSDPRFRALVTKVGLVN
jgi:TolB-like protein/Tfp pilus assembly protein PilF